MKLEILVLMTVVMGEILFVTSQDCPAFGKLKFGRVKYRSRRKIARFRCRRRFQILGAKLSICLKGQWNHPAPVCIAPGCDIPDPTPHLIMTPSKNDALLTLECESGYGLHGPESVYCDGNKWSAPLSTCKYMEPDLLCQFESSRLCGWTQYKGDNFDWTVNSGGTSTDRTGPDNDHTLGAVGGGHYMYIESSSPRSLGHKATILSPPYRDLPNGTCFEFYYHMKGKPGPNEVGSLFVYVRRGDEDVEELVPSFSESDHQSTEWLRGSFEISDVNSTIQIVISGIRGKSYIGDIAIDDVRLYNCSDDDDVTTDSALDTTMQWTTDLPEMTSMGSNDISTMADLVTTILQHAVPTADSSVTLDQSLTTDVSIAPPDVVEITTESLSTEKAATEMTSQPTAAGVFTTPMPTTEEVTTEATTTIGTSGTTVPPTTTTKATTTVETTTTPSTTTTTIPKSTSPTSTTTQSTSTTTPTTITTTPATTTTPPTITTTPATPPPPPTTPPTTVTPTTITTTTPATTTPPPPPTTTPTPTTTTTTTPPTTTTTTPTTTVTATTATTTTTTTTATTATTTATTTPVTHSSVSTKQPSTTTTTTTTTTKARPITTTVDNAIPELTRSPPDNNETDIPNVILVGKRSDQSKGPVKPLMIGVGVGVAIGLAIVLVIVFLYMKKQRKKHEDMEDEMSPIARNAYSEW